MRLKVISIFALLTLSSCNMFSGLDSGGSLLEKCKGLADAGDLEAAATACEAAVTADPTNMEAHLEYADVSLANLGIGLSQLSDVFLKSTTGTTTIVTLAESLITAGRLTVDNTTASKQHAKDAITAFDNYGVLLIAEDPTHGPEIAAFYAALARLCSVSVIMAYADINGNQDGEITQDEICNGNNPNCVTATQTNFCVNDLTAVGNNGITCEGISTADAAEAADNIETIKDVLPAMFPNNADLKDVIDTFSSTTIIDPVTLNPITIDNAAATYKGDAARDILRQIAR